MTDLRTLPTLPLGAVKEEIAPAGERPELLWVPVRDLRIDASYQRALLKNGRALALRIAGGWDWNLAGVLTVAEIDGGRFEVIDGQHRAVAALARGDIHHLPALRARCATVADRARTFAALNTARVAVTATQRHRAAVAAGDTRALRIEALAAAAGVRILANFCTADWKPRDTVAVIELGRILDRDGEDVLRVALKACAAAGFAPIRREHLTALAALLGDPAWGVAALDLVALVAALRDWDAVADAADLARADSGDTRSRALAVELWRRAAAPTLAGAAS